MRRRRFNETFLAVHHLCRAGAVAGQRRVRRDRLCPRAGGAGLRRSECNLYVQTDGDEILANCVPDSGTYFFLSGNATKFSEIYELMLLSFNEGRTLNIRIVEGSNPCEIAWVALTRA
jgi:hypothetical protein